VTTAFEIIANTLVSASEGQLGPRHFVRAEPPRFETLIVNLQGPADQRRGKDDDDRRPPWIGVDVDEVVDAHCKAALLARFALRGGEDLFAAIDVAAGEYPFAVARFDRATHQQNAPLRVADDRADRNLRIQVEHVPTRRTDQAIRIARLEASRLESAAAHRAETEDIGHVVLARRSIILIVMSILKVARLGHPVLRAKAKPIDPHDIKSPTIQKLIDDMMETMNEYHGIGLAAPQVHESLRLFVAGIEEEDPRTGATEIVPVAIINPDVTPIGRDLVEDWEGCLSIPDIRGMVPRFTDITVAALDRHGKKIELRLKDFAARVAQHETDHLDGVLFFDRMTSMQTLTYLEEYSRYHSKDDD